MEAVVAEQQKQPRVWQPMTLRWVGDVGLVMTRKSGRVHDSFWHRRRKRRHGYNWD